MKRRLHLLLLLLLSLTLPLNGVAGVLAFSEPCPMEQHGISMEDMQASCCEDHQQQMSSGKVCKTGQECKSSSMLQVSVIKTPLLFSRSVVITPTHDFLPTASPSGVWRPPRLIPVPT
ncbi:hypothetical protein [Pseudomonas aeruginosa]|uniref:hypothetical protein n=1 Tax=Pseudomonas aeruginosa TaxID=287 RepID=UPI0013C22E9E|nr:hypothetical protein [Pseudomonas aeruginosa]NDZ07177.1 hypothetical protein [Pseudomonas aeruginosa]